MFPGHADTAFDFTQKRVKASNVLVSALTELLLK